MKTYYKTFIILVFIFITVNNIIAQELSIGTTVVNRYIWRGTDFGDSPSIQPTVALTAGGFTGGFWGAYPTATTGTEEIDLYAGYNIGLNNSGTIYLGFTDYMFPTSTGFELTNFNDYDDTAGAGSHFLEINAGYTGPETFPISLSFNIFVYNLADNPIFFQLGYTTAVNDIGLNLFLGGAAGDGAAYYGAVNDDGTPKTFDIVYTGITATKEITITDSFSIPVFGSIIANPASESLFYVVGFTL
jgi:hypothetical protein